MLDDYVLKTDKRCCKETGKVKTLYKMRTTYVQRDYNKQFIHNEFTNTIALKKTKQMCFVLMLVVF